MLALAVVGLLLTGIIAVFVPARKAIHGSLAVQEADRLTMALSAELATLRPTERQKYDTPFEKAYDWMRKTDIAGRSILIYNYRGDLKKKPRPDGSLQPYTKGRNFVPGDDTMVTSAVVLAENDRHRLTEDADAVVGTVFVVRMTQLIWETSSSNSISSRARGASRNTSYGERGGGKYVLADKPGVISNPYSRNNRIDDPKSYMYDPSNKNETPWGAEVLYYAEFFQLPSLINARNNLKYENMKQPLFSRCLSFRR